MLQFYWLNWLTFFDRAYLKAEKIQIVINNFISIHMTDLFAKKDNVSDEDQIFRSAIIFLGLKSKVKEDAKFRTPENQ
jgi:uncharacterized membrane protein